MAGPGLYYPPPPVFVGGRQPYAPAQPLVTSTVTAIPASPDLQHRQIQAQILAAWAPKPLIIVWSGPAGATEEAPDPPVPLPATSLGLVHLFPVLAQWQPVFQLPLLPKLLAPVAPPETVSPVAPGPNIGQRHLVTVLRTWQPTPRIQILMLPAVTPAQAAGTGGGRLIGPNRLARA